MLRTHIIIKSLIFALFAVLICLSPTLNIIPKKLVVTSFHDSQRLLELVFISIVLLYSVIPKHPFIVINETLRNALYALIALAITSSYLSLSPRHAYIEISLFAGLSYFAILIMRLHHENHAQLIKWLTYAFWAGISLSMVSFYVGYITATVFKTPVIWPAPLTGFGNVRFFNQYQLWTLGLITLPLLAFDLKHTYTRRMLHIGLVAWWAILFFSGSRGVLLASLVGVISTAIIYKKTAWPFIRLQLMHITAGLISYVVLFQIIPNLRESAVVTGTIMRDTTSDRLELWKLSLELIREHPFFGVGPMNFAWYNNGISAHPHNSLLQLMAEWGLPATAIIVSLAGYGLFCWIKRFNTNSLQSLTKLNFNLVIVLFFTLITNAIYSLVDGVIVMPISQVMMFTIMGLALGLYHEQHQAIIKEKSIFTSIFAGLVLITLVWSTLPEIVQSASGSTKHFSVGYSASGPRLWQEVK